MREIKNYYIGIEVNDSNGQILRNWFMIVLVLNTPSMVFNLIMYYESLQEIKVGFLGVMYECFFEKKITFSLDLWFSIDEYSRLCLIFFFILANVIYISYKKKDTEGNFLVCCGVFLLLFSMYHFGWIVFGFV